MTLYWEKTSIRTQIPLPTPANHPHLSSTWTRSMGVFEAMKNTGVHVNIKRLEMERKRKDVVCCNHSWSLNPVWNRKDGISCVRDTAWASSFCLNAQFFHHIEWKRCPSRLELHCNRLSLCLQAGRGT